jgi:hypothetical protein
MPRSLIAAARLSLLASCLSLAVLTPRVLADTGTQDAAPASGQPGVVTVATPNPTFRVLHDDHIGALALPAGTYALTPFGGLTAAQATQRFGRFLQDFDGKLPSSWTLDPAAATFSNGTAGFAVTQVAATTPATASSTGTRCPGVFVVEHNDRIGALRFPAGSYVVTSLQSSCRTNMNSFRRLLARTDNALPAPWRLNTQTGAFSTSAGARFSVKAVQA